MSEWISVKDRLPNDEDLKKSEEYDFLCRVIIPQDGGDAIPETRICHFGLFERKWDTTGIIVTHWMPLPDPPKED